MTTEAHPPVRTTLADVVDVARRRGDVVAAALRSPLAPYYLLIGATVLLLSIGLLEVLSASSITALEGPHHNSYYYFERQLIWAAIGIPAAYGMSLLRHTFVRRFAWLAVLVSLVLVILTQTPLGLTVNGNRNWVNFGGPFQIQPAELAKFSLILWISHIYARKIRLLGDWRHVLIPVLPMVAVITGLVVVLGGDLGTGLVLFAIALGMLFVAGAPMKIFVGAATGIGVVALALAATSPERVSRMTSFADPFKDLGNTGYQAGHGILGMASGGILGKGIGASQQKWGTLPEPHTDFIFAVLGEELGLVGTLLVLGLFGALIYAGLRISLRASDPFVKFFSAGITVWIAVQMVINIGMVLALLPVIGVPLPLVSYGGSSLVPMLVSIGLLASFARREPDAARALTARRRARRGSAGVPDGPRSTAVRGGRTPSVGPR